MTQLFFLFGSSFVIGLSGAMMPGPVLTATISETAKRGFMAGPLIVLGHGLLEVGVVVAVVAGLGPWLERDPVFGTLGVVGGLLLAVLGVITVRSARTASLQPESEAGKTAPPIHGPVLAGMATTLSNPYWWLWWSTIGLTYMALSRDTAGTPGLLSFYFGHISADLAWLCLVAAAVAAGRRVCPPAVYRWVLTACGVALVALGLYFLVQGWLRLTDPTETAMVLLAPFATTDL
jgi:threonine/homoserine/homoserine lactone efflux protein